MTPNLFFQNLEISPFDRKVADAVLQEIQKRLGYLLDVGLNYLTLDRLTHSLSGGEFQRINLSTSLGSPLVGAIYILDEPTTGLHFDDISKLLKILDRLVDAGNTVLVIEHNMEVIKTADSIIDMGPEGGNKGGRVIACGTPEEIAASKNSYTGRFLKKCLKKYKIRVNA